MTTRHGRPFAMAAALAMLALTTACETRLDPKIGGIRPPAIKAPTGPYDLVEVNDAALPHTTTQNNTTYALLSGTFALNADSTWLYSSVTQQPGPNGTVLTSQGNYIGRWTVTDSTINLVQPASGTIKVKGDSLFWTGGPRYSWEAPLVYTLVRR
ncbi:MAG TPA: hypothetical protein VFO55_03835 [Gemmatimonadaceae bacterium]|nr:hypothetical protein [Gemmatimonadaceae bacterium]